MKSPDHQKMTKLIADIQALESRAYKLGLLVTARGLNQAKNVAGYECAGEIVEAGKALTGWMTAGR